MNCTTNEYVISYFTSDGRHSMRLLLRNFLYIFFLGCEKYIKIFKLCKYRCRSYTELCSIAVAASTIIMAAADIAPVTALEVMMLFK